MTYIIIGIVILLGLAFYAYDFIKAATINTRNAISGKEKMLQQTWITWMHVTCFLIICMMIIWQQEFSQFLHRLF